MRSSLCVKFLFDCFFSLKVYRGPEVKEAERGVGGDMKKGLNLVRPNRMALLCGIMREQL